MHNIIATAFNEKFNITGILVEKGDRKIVYIENFATNNVSWRKWVCRAEVTAGSHVISQDSIASFARFRKFQGESTQQTSPTDAMANARTLNEEKTKLLEALSEFESYFNAG